MDLLTAAVSDLCDVSAAVRALVMDGTLTPAAGFDMLCDAIDGTVRPALAMLS